LGKTGIEVTELCFGALPLGPLQKNISLADGAQLIRLAIDRGINFIDTAQLSRTYPYIKEALKGFTGEVIIASKSFASSYEDMDQSVQEALGAMGREYIDIFHLHAARVEGNIFENRAGAIDCLKEYKKKGIVRAIGISTHMVEVVKSAAENRDIDIIFPIINKIGLGIVDGSVEEMLAAIKKANEAGKGLYAMKALGGGHLIDDIQDAYDFVRKIPGISSVAVGMVNTKELDLNLRLFNDEKVTPEDLPVKAADKKLIVSIFCKGCGKCVTTCPSAALSLQEGKTLVDVNKCVLCGYCNPICPEFALRLA
jgi:aryl-alcohol dehydrogenase-like predicted oxidoreductase